MRRLVAWIAAALLATLPTPRTALGDEVEETRPEVARVGDAIRALDAVQSDPDRARRLASELRELGDSLHVAGADSLAARAWQTVGWVHFRRGDVDSAAAIWNAALDAARATADDRLIAGQLNSAGIGRTVTGDTEGGIAHWREAIEICRRIGDRELEGRFWGNLANAYARLGRVEEVRRATEHSLEIDRETGNEFGVAAAHSRLATLMQQRMDFAPALVHADSGVVIMQRADPRRLSVPYMRRSQIHFDMGHTEEAFEDLAAADSVSKAIGDLRALAFQATSRATMLHSLERFDEAIQIIDTIDSTFANESGDRMASLLSLRGNALLQLGRNEEARADLETAYDLWITARDHHSDSTDRAGFFQNGGDIYACLAEFHRRQGDVETAWRFAEEGRAGEFRGALDEGARVISISELQAILGSCGGVLLQYTDATNVPIDLFVVTADSVQVVSIGRVGKLLDDAGFSMQLMSSGGTDEECAAPLGRLADVLLPPSARVALAAAEHAYVVPPSRLLPLPFEALPLDGETLLSDRVAVTYLPGASALQLLEARPSGSDPMVVFADPASDTGFDESPTLRSAALIPLPEARKEARRVATADARLWIGPEARAERVAQSASASVLHFATHAVVDEFSTASTGLLLAGPDGLLTPDDIAGFPLRADLVTLSGCRTVGGFTYLGEGTFGVARSFLLSGARSVVTSAWDVEDGAARHFMELFYANLRDGLPRDESLRLAQVTMKRQGYPLRDRCAFTLTGVGHAPVEALTGAAPRESGTLPLAIWVALGLAVLLVSRRFLFKRRRNPA